jgi:uncharacterized phiE125 gp8 family phage protein
MNNLTLITGPTAQPISLEEVKEHLYIVNSDTTRDNYLSDIQDSAVDQFQSDTEYQVMEATYKLTLPDFPSDYIDIPLIPVSSITTFSYYTDKTSTSTLVLDTDFWLVKNDRSAKLYPVNSWPSAGDRPDAVQITFVAGYSTQSQIPTRLLHGLKFLIGHYNENRQSVVVGPNVQEIPDSYAAIADKFKRHSF